MDEIQLPKICFSCAHYIQHYIWRDEIVMIHFGRCLKKDKKSCNPSAKACQLWEERPASYSRHCLAPVPHVLFIKDGVIKIDPTE